MNSTKTPTAVWACIALCAALCVYSLGFRYRVESRNRAVALAVEAEQVAALAWGEGANLESALGRLRQNGVSALVIREGSIGEMISSGELRIETERLPRSQSSIVRLIGGAEACALAETALNRRFRLGANQIGVEIQGEGAKATVELAILNVSPDLIRETPTGLNGEHARAAELAGLDVVARCANVTGSTESYVEKAVRDARIAGATYFLPTGEQILGFRDSQAALQEALQANGILYASPEFSKIAGDASMLAKSTTNSVRLHAAQANEVDKLTRAGYIERYAKAASERGVRVLLLRPLTNSDAYPLSSFGDLVAAVSKQIAKEGGEVRRAHAFESPQVPKWLFAAIGLSLAPVAVFAMYAVGLGDRRGLTIAAIGFVALGAAAYFESARNYSALVGATMLPVVAIASIPSFPRPVAVRFLLTSLVSMVGGLAVAALLNDVPFFLRADQFAGVKVAVFLPILFGGYIAFRWFWSPRGALEQPIKWIHALLGIVIVALFAFMAMRTGNDNPAGVSGFEARIRMLLEQWLVVRPRTKEFLIGHPAMIVGLGMLANCARSEAYRNRWAGWAVLAILTGAIGQTSIVNTMCHLHTPLQIGLVRTGIGLVVGGLIGAAAWLVVRTATRIPNSVEEPIA